LSVELRIKFLRYSFGGKKDRSRLSAGEAAKRVKLEGVLEISVSVSGKLWRQYVSTRKLVEIFP